MRALTRVHIRVRTKGKGREEMMMLVVGRDNDEGFRGAREEPRVRKMEGDGSCGYGDGSGPRRERSGGCDVVMLGRPRGGQRKERDDRPTAEGKKVKMEMDGETVALMV
ncbi:hypothetical protein CRG98_041847 [Punica granatum]|uniref:Uncharacterized protein n=1 Tax=Punica granatum TaxID=22663 RepID=A0A2I0I2U9_PUNGR|nr:hypothetical protein CRG98_041847 [Punica granatum]